MVFVPAGSFRPEPLPSLVRDSTFCWTQTGTPPMASAIVTTPLKSIIMKWSIGMCVSSCQAATVQPGPPRLRDSLVWTRPLLAWWTLPPGSVHFGIISIVSRGMETTDMLLRSADRCSSICTSARGGPSKVSLAPPRAWLAASSRASEPMRRMFSGVWPKALGLEPPSLFSPRFRTSVLMLPLRWR